MLARISSRIIRKSYQHRTLYDTYAAGFAECGMFAVLSIIPLWINAWDMGRKSVLSDPKCTYLSDQEFEMRQIEDKYITKFKAELVRASVNQSEKFTELDKQFASTVQLAKNLPGGRMLWSSDLRNEVARFIVDREASRDREEAKAKALKEVKSESNV